MTDRESGERKPQDIGRDSPASEEAKEQGLSGAAGAREAQIDGVTDQPPQGSDRAPAARFQQPQEQRKHFARGQAPSEQGEKGHPSPEMIKKNQQGGKQQSGSHSSRGERVEEEAQRGEPSGEHTRDGPRDMGGTRPGHRSDA